MRKTLLIALCVVTTVGATDMRTVPFKDVLWAVARKAGYSPESGNFLSNQAIPIGEYINEYVDKLYPQEDWPQWTHIVQAAVNVNHVVVYDRVLSSTDPNALPEFHIGRVLAVYLVDPTTTRSPARTSFTLRDDGIHVGFDHGTYVWVKYLEPAPTFTAVPWRAGTTYSDGDTVYSPTTGECYSSLVNNNVNHDPSTNFSHVDLNIEETQPLIPTNPGIAAQNQKVEVTVEAIDGTPISDPMPLNDAFTLGIGDVPDVFHWAHTEVQGGASSISTMLTSLKAAFDGDAIPGMTFTVVPPNKFVIESSTNEFVLNFWHYLPLNIGEFFLLKFVQNQPFISSLSPSNAIPQKLKITVGDNAFIPGAEYSVTVTDLDGSRHTVTYESDLFDGKQQILNGILLAIGSSSDPVIGQIGTSIDVSEPSATLSILRVLGVAASVQPPASQFWKLVPFPQPLVNAVVRGASADLLGEWGQGDRQTMEEQKVPGDESISRGDFETTPTAPLTTQQRPYSRYRIQSQ